MSGSVSGELPTKPKFLHIYISRNLLKVQRFHLDLSGADPVQEFLKGGGRGGGGVLEKAGP